MDRLGNYRKSWGTKCNAEILTAQEIKKNLLLATDTMGRTAWYVAARWSKLGILQEIWEWAK
jgi:hypothetical protein